MTSARTDLRTWADVKTALRRDFRRICSPEASRTTRLRLLLSRRFKLLIALRLSEYLWDSPALLHRVSRPVANLFFRRYQSRLGLSLTPSTKIGGGICFMHGYGTVFASGAEIGRDCTVFQGVTIGRGFGNRKSGCPRIGDNCILFAGAKIIGGITLGNRVVVGANAVVVNDVPDGCVVVGVPARIVSTDSSAAVAEEWKSFFEGY